MRIPIAAFIHDSKSVSQRPVLINKIEQIYQPRVPRRSARLRIRGVDYHVSEWGEAGSPLLVLLHGWGDTGSSFQFLVDEFEGEWFVVAPDWRGFGATRCRADAYWFPDYLADLDRILAIYSPTDPVRLVGHSMGANVAGLFAGILPERVAAFVNVEGFGLKESDPRNAPDNYRRWIERSRDREPRPSYRNFGDLARRISKRNPRMSADQAMFVAGLWAEQLDDGSVVLRADPAHRLPNAVQYRRAEAQACWERISAPVLVIRGAESDFYDRAKQHAGPEEIDVFKTAESVEIEGAGHMLHFEQPAALAAAIEGFLTRL